MNELKFTDEQATQMLLDILDISYGYSDVDVAVKRYLKILKEKGYITPIKEEPLFVHNVMSYKGKNYLKQIGTDCSDCHIHNELCTKLPCQNGEDYIWKSFDDIKLTDELSCTRKDIGDIYIKHRVSKDIFRFTHTVSGQTKNVVYNGCIEYNGGLLMPIAFDLATAEELKEYLNKT